MNRRIVFTSFVLVMLASVAVSAFAGGNGLPNPPPVRGLSARDDTLVFLPLISVPKRLPAFTHVYIVVMENEDYGDIIGSADAPYINLLSTQYALATNYSGVAHPSQPNYIALFSGSTQGVTDDNQWDISAPNVADQLERAGKTWKMFAQNYPLGCYTGMVASGGADGPGDYARRHVPAMSFTGISQDPARCANITSFANFDPAAADYQFIVPNLCNDMHDCPVATGDAFLAGFVPTILASPAWQNGGVLFITWDENKSYAGTGGGLVPTLIIGNGVQSGFQSAASYDHYSLLRTIQNSWHLGCLAESCRASDFLEFFH